MCFVGTYLHYKSSVTLRREQCHVRSTPPYCSHHTLCSVSQLFLIRIYIQVVAIKIGKHNWVESARYLGWFLTIVDSISNLSRLCSNYHAFNLCYVKRGYELMVVVMGVSYILQTDDRLL